MTKKELLAEITFDKIRRYVRQPSFAEPISKKDIDYVTGIVVHRVRKVIRGTRRTK